MENRKKNNYLAGILCGLEIMHIKQEAVAGAQRMMLMMINREIYIKLLSQDIYSKDITEKNTADALNVFPMALNIRIHYEDSS